MRHPTLIAVLLAIPLLSGAPARAERENCADCARVRGTEQSAIVGGARALQGISARVIEDSLDRLGDWKCSSPDPALGVSCRGRLKGIYPDEVAVFVPAAYKPKDRAELILHLHGHRASKEARGTGKGNETFDDVLEEFKFGPMLAESRRDSILIVPSSRGRNLDYASSFKSEMGFNAFMDALGEAFAQSGLAASAEPARLTVSGHSGAYNPISMILAHPCPSAKRVCYRKKIDQLLLIDSTFDATPQLVRFAKESPPKRLVSVVLEDSATEKYSVSIWRETLPEDEAARVGRLPFSKRLARFRAATYDETAPPSMLPAAGVSFIHVSHEGANHWSVVNQYLPALLKRQAVETSVGVGMFESSK